MLVFPGWSMERSSVACRRAQWAPDPRLAPYVAPPHPLQPAPHAQIEDEYSSSSCGSSPEHGGCGVSEGWCEPPAPAAADAEHECRCEWVGCGARARGVAALSAHVAHLHAHPHTDGLFYCGWRACSRPHRGFNARYKMLVHVRTHTNEKPHACPQCHKCFSRAENLKIHMRSHSGEKPYVCPFQGCSKAYSNSSDRFKHTRTHAVDKPYCCKVAGCDKRYTDPSSLRKHVKTYKHFADRTPSPYAASHHPPASPTSPAANSPRATDSISPGERTLGAIFDDRAVRVPAYEMSYVEYSRLYSGYPAAPTSPAYRSLDALLRGKDYVYEATAYGDVAATQLTPRPTLCEPLPRVEPEEPLDLKCRRSFLEPEGRVLVRAIEDSMEFQLVRAMEMPLDLSNKS